MAVFTLRKAGGGSNLRGGDTLRLGPDASLRTETWIHGEPVAKWIWGRLTGVWRDETPLT